MITNSYTIDVIIYFLAGIGFYHSCLWIRSKIIEGKE